MPSLVLTTASRPGAPALRLRPWRPDDAAALVAAHRDTALRRWLRNVVDDEDGAARWLAAMDEEWATGTRLAFAITETPRASGTGPAPPEEAGRPGPAAAAAPVPPERDRPIGHIALRGIANGSPTAEVGYWTASEARGRGIASRALEAVASWALDVRRRPAALARLERVELIHAVDNTASCRVAEKAGFALEQVLPPTPDWPSDGHLHVRRLPDAAHGR